MEPTPSSPPGTYDFVVTLKSPSFRYINRVSQLLLAIFLVTYFFYMFRIGMFGKNLWMLVIPLLIMGLWLYGWVRSADKTFQVHYRIELMIAAMSWILLPLFEYHQWIGWGYALLAVIERWVKVPDEFGFTKDLVVRNSFPRRKYQWVEIDNVVIRNNLFTLDLRNNKIIQKELEEPIAREVEEEFNAWCRQQLHFTL
ncbi:MAG: hypothetical protein MUF29_07575 [Chitinophagaceae bacterium]|nr:hypothetical protein [Chitinophagaceae bacterium]